MLVDYQPRGQAQTRETSQERLEKLPPTNPQQRLTALPACKDEKTRENEQKVPSRRPPFLPGRVEFGTFGEVAGQRSGRSPSQFPRRPRKPFCFEEREGSQSEAFLEREFSPEQSTGWCMQQLDAGNSDRASSMSGDFNRLVETLIGKTSKASGTPRRQKKILGSSFEHELQNAGQESCNVPGKWLIDQARAARDAGTRRLHSFGTSYAGSTGPPVIGEKVTGVSSGVWMGDDGVHVGSVDKGPSLWNGEGFKHRRPALDMDGYDASALLRAAPEVLLSGEDTAVADEASCSESLSSDMKKHPTCTCGYICLVVCLALSAFSLTGSQKDLHKKHGCAMRLSYCFLGSR